VLYSFGQLPDGAISVAGVTLDPKHNLYGTASAGGSFGSGTVFQLKRSKSSWTENILYNFQGGSDGSVPYAGVILDHAGNLYGGVTGGGTGAGGTIFELTPSSSGWTFSVLYNLPGWSLSGPFRNLMMDASGNLYGTTHCDGAYEAGTAYKLTPSGGTWTYTSLYVFTGRSDGTFSYSNLVLDKQGHLYGTTDIGGTDGAGVVFKITPITDTGDVKRANPLSEVSRLTHLRLAAHQFNSAMIYAWCESKACKELRADLRGFSGLSTCDCGTCCPQIRDPLTWLQYYAIILV